ncbi:MAG: helix-turn-helix transcriptional regulator [Candidatus Aenigmatarchaeota archaeon]
MRTIQKLIIIVIILAGFIFSVSFSTLYAQTHIIEGTACSCTLPIPLLIPTFSSLGVFVGSIVYYLLFPKIEEGGSKEDFNLFLDFLDPDEKVIVQKIVENNGKITQSKLSSQFGKVKVFRVLEDLRKKGIIEKEAYGKTNTVKLSGKFSKFLS